MTVYRKFELQESLPFCHIDEFLSKLPPSQNHFPQIDLAVDFEVFRPEIENAVQNFRRQIRKGGNAGRPCWDPVYIFKCLVAQRRLGLSFKAFHAMMLSDLRLHKFLGILHPGHIPSWQTLHHYFQIFTDQGLFEDVFIIHVEELAKMDERIGTKAQVCDGSYMPAPRQRNTREENEKIKNGEGHELWTDHFWKKIHKDIDARWALKNGETFYGYKLSASVCVVSKMIVACHTTAASVHDAKAVDPLIEALPFTPRKTPDFPKEYDWEMPLFLADSGYVGERISQAVYERGWKPVICAKGTRGHPLTPEIMASNREVSTLRSRVEHAFGFIEGSMGGLKVRSIGLARATANAFLTCFIYNLCRASLTSQSP